MLIRAVTLLVMTVAIGMTAVAMTTHSTSSSKAPCNPKQDPGCNNFTVGPGELQPIPEAAEFSSVAPPCDPKTDPGCN